VALENVGAIKVSAGTTWTIRNTS